MKSVKLMEKYRIGDAISLLIHVFALEESTDVSILNQLEDLTLEYPDLLGDYLFETR